MKKIYIIVLFILLIFNPCYGQEGRFDANNHLEWTASFDEQAGYGFESESTNTIELLISFSSNVGASDIEYNDLLNNLTFSQVDTENNPYPGIGIESGTQPDWITNVEFNNSKTGLNVTAKPNYTGEIRGYVLTINLRYANLFSMHINNGDSGNFKEDPYILLTQESVNTDHLWYRDTDGDGFGNLGQEAIYSTDPIPGMVHNTDDKCPEEYSEYNNGCLDVYENRNYTRYRSYNITGELIGVGKSYFNSLGKHVQSQTYNITDNKIWITKTLYDTQGRPAFNSLTAPFKDYTSGYASNFVYDDSFISTMEGNFSVSDFENDDIYNPTKLNESSNTLGAYYSNNGPTNQDITDRPYSRTIYSELNPGAVLKTIGGNKTDVDGDGVYDWDQGFSYTFQATQEVYYAFGSNEFSSNISEDYIASLTEDASDQSIINENKLDVIWLKATKQVVQDINGVEAVVFTDTDGKTLASAKAGGNTEYPVMSLIGEQGFVDIHIPVGCENSLSFVENTNPSFYKVWDLRTERELNVSEYNSTNLPAGFYRIEYVGSDKEDRLKYPNLTKLDGGDIKAVFPDKAVGVTYNVNYYDYSLNYYDKADRLTSTLQPLGFKNSVLNGGIQSTVNHDEHLKSTFGYNTLGQLVESTSPDEGTAKFMYREDGQIRFSQNSKQALAGEFSYTNYDPLARPIESGVATGNFSDLDADNTASLSGEKEVLKTIYDISEDLYSKLNANIHGDYSFQTFVRGNVSCTKNDDIETYYSYDIYGRVKWIVRYVIDLDKAFTIDYTYDPVTSEVTTVEFQKTVHDELYMHRYIYNEGGQLTDVLTATDTDGPNSWKHQVSYKYYENGSLKRKELAKTLLSYVESTGEVNYVQENGKDKVLQGTDYVYNLAGQLKQINGVDGLTDPGGDNNDAFGMTIGYYPGDYKRTGDLATKSQTMSGIPQYNGNISNIVWENSNSANEENKYYYRYDKQTNWLKGASFNESLSDGDPNIEEEVFVAEAPTEGNIVASKSITLTNGFTFAATSTANLNASLSTGYVATKQTGDYNVYGLDYDVNGNIKALNRNGYAIAGDNKMDELEYVYDPLHPNQLQKVIDHSDKDYNSDFKGETEYTYNEIGQLVREDVYEDTSIGRELVETNNYRYNTAGLVTTVYKRLYALEKDYTIEFTYDDLGQRLTKELKLKDNTISKTHYIRDASGNVMAIYDENENQIEVPIYGAGRVGVASGNLERYEVTDHLGNVRSVVTRETESKSFSDYFPFGMPMPNRNSITSNDYRYAYQGQEKDPETGKEAFELRLWDSRIGRWLTTDPKRFHDSPYLGMGNNPITLTDPDGGNPVYGSEGNYRGNTVEGFVGEALIYNGNANFSKMTADQLVNNQGANVFTFERFKMTDLAQDKVLTHMLDGFTLPNGLVLDSQKNFDINTSGGDSMNYNAKYDGIVNGKHTTTDFGLYYEYTVENIRSTFGNHEIYGHGIMYNNGGGGDTKEHLRIHIMAFNNAEKGVTDKWIHNSTYNIITLYPEVNSNKAAPYKFYKAHIDHGGEKIW